MNKLFFTFLLVSITALFACNTQTTDEETKVLEEEKKVDDLIKSDQERIDSFKKANGL